MFSISTNSTNSILKTISSTSITSTIKTVSTSTISTTDIISTAEITNTSTISTTFFSILFFLFSLLISSITKILHYFSSIKLVIEYLILLLLLFLF